MKQSRADNKKKRVNPIVRFFTSRAKQRNMKRYMLNKLVIVFGLVSLALFALALYLVFLIRDTNNDYSVEVLSRHGYTSSTIQAKRGDIVDRNGTKIATSEPYYILVLDPKVILYDENYTKKTVDTLAEYFGLDTAEVEAAVRENPNSSYLRFGGKTLLEYERVSAFETYQSAWNAGTYQYLSADGEKVPMTDEEKKTKIKGVWFEIEYQRNYPFSDQASKVIGFTSSDGVEGLWGLENYYNDTLVGVNGRSLGYLDEDYDLQQNIYAATDGNTVVSTIDMAAQRILQENISAFTAQIGAANVGIMLMNPQNGEIYAMATDSEYDLNHPNDLSVRYTEEEIAVMTEKERNTALNQIWRNFCLSDSYEPGSTAKVMTVATGLEEGILNGNETYLCDGHEYRGGWKINCVNTLGHGLETLADAVANSCNDALMQIGSAIGAEHMAGYQRIFNYGQATGIDLPGEATCAGLLYEAEDMHEAEIATTSFGQGYNVTMIQQAAAVASVINGGYYYQPHLVKEIRNAEGAVIETKEPILVRQTISSETSTQMRKMMRAVVESGTGGYVNIAGYEIGGKTGAAEKLPRGTGDFVISFVSFVGMEHPELLLYVVIDTPNVADQSSSATAQFLAREIWLDLLPYYNVFPNEELIPEGQTAGQAPENPYVDDSYDIGSVIVIDPEIPEEPVEDDPAAGEDPGEGEQAPAEGEQILADGEQTPAEGEQTPVE